eukprot:1239531-Alexandrium_andersonii.AAC.1
MSASLVGSEMCIRDSVSAPPLGPAAAPRLERPPLPALRCLVLRVLCLGCLLYTSDAADDM